MSSGESPQALGSVPPSRSRSSTKLVDDVTSLTSFNPFSEEDENDQSSYALVTSLFSRMRNIAAPISSAVAAAAGGSANGHPTGSMLEHRRPSASTGQNTQSKESLRGVGERPGSLNPVTSNPAPPLVSLTPVVSEAPTFNADFDRSPSRAGYHYAPVQESNDGGIYGTTIPGFPIQDDARSIRTSTSLKKSASVSKVIRRIRGEGLSRDYWMDDENCKECYDCKSVFTTWRRKHHCRICGQIFCSRCASNIIKGSRFGHDGMVRVCNLCLEKLAKVDDDDDDDRRSIASGVSFPAHQLGVDRLDSFSQGLGHHPQSPFAASQLFGRTDEPFNLYSIAETKHFLGSDDSLFGSRPMSPHEDNEHDPRDCDSISNVAPFRRGFSDEEKDTALLADHFVHDNYPTAPESKTPIDFPITVPVAEEGAMSSIQFPGSSPEHTSRPGSVSRSRVDSYADLDVPTPFMRSRVQSRLDQFAVGEAGWRTRRESTAYAQELNLISMFHLRIMLRQMLTTEKIPNFKEWEEVLLKLSLQLARDLTFTTYTHHEGADMDVRRYVKIKKIPGGSPKDSEYIDGAMITKNVAHKQMSRIQRNPRVMLVTFPLEFHRVEGQYMQFGQIVRQEKEYLTNLASRIAALRPHVVLVEKSVSRLALEALVKHNIAVARNVKESAISLVGRMLQGHVFSSIDKLALEPRLGHCARFRVQTFDHPLIPGRRKTFMRFEGCSRDLGCTIVLRGGDLETLKRIKKVTRFLTFIVRNLKLETHLWKDSVIALPPITANATPMPTTSRPPPNVSTGSPAGPIFPHFLHLTSTSPSDMLDMHSPDAFSEEPADEDLPSEDADQLRLSRRIRKSLAPYLKTFISVSATLRFPPPYPIRRMKELDDDLQRIRRAWEDEVVRREERVLHRHSQEVTITPSANPSIPDDDDIKALIECLPSPVLSLTLSQSSPEGNTPRPNGTTGYFDHKLASSSSSSSLSSTNASRSDFPPTRALEDLPLKLKDASDIALESQLASVKQQHEEQRRVWEWYLRKNCDDFVVEKYQCISVQEFTLPMEELGTHRPCFPPRLTDITFYGENDCTLGQYVEKAVTDTLVNFLDPKAVCLGKGCNQPLARHCRVFTHNETRLFIAVERWAGEIKSHSGFTPSPDLITTWSACRVCGSATPFIPVSEEMQRYSFAKFLELHFYPADVQLVQGAGCMHNIYQHHIRYFALKGMTVRFQTDPIVLYEISYPPIHTHVWPETSLQLKNTDHERLQSKNVQWYTLLVRDLKALLVDAATGNEEADEKLAIDINRLIERAELEKLEIMRLINHVYKDSSPYDTLALNQVRAQRQDKIVAWQQDFDRLPKPKVLTEKDIRKSTFGSVRAMFPNSKRYDWTSGTYDNHHLPSSNILEAEEGTLVIRKVTGDSFTSTSSASEASGVETGVEGSDQDHLLKTKPETTVSGTATHLALSASGVKSDPDSDSTIEATDTIKAIAGDRSQSPDDKGLQSGLESDDNAWRTSKLPRRPGQLPSVAELVRKYQDYLPPQVSEQLATAALPPPGPMSESEQETAPSNPIRLNVRSRARNKALVRNLSTSDFEQSYAANIAPKYLTHSRRAFTQVPHASRIPGPAAPPLESRASSRRTSPEKRTQYVRANSATAQRLGRLSPPPTGKASSATAPTKSSKGKTINRNPNKEKTLSRTSSSAGPKATFRRAVIGPGSKVSNIARHFERINKDNERANRRYAVIRGKRARPVTSARAKVEVLESVKDAIKDESESSESSSEADDEDEDDEDAHFLPNVQRDIDLPHLVVKDATKTTVDGPASSTPSNDVSGPESAEIVVPDSLPHVPSHEQLPSLPASPLFPGFPMAQTPSLTPPTPDLDMGPGGSERHSILKALSGLWPQSRLRPEFEEEDPMTDPEHIFRDSSMVVRTDEPTSIIALALNSPQYREMLLKARADKRQAKEPKLTDGEAFMPDDQSVAESTSTWGVVNVGDVDDLNPTEDLRSPSSKLPWAISFESGGLTISCTVLYPEQFDALRRTYDCEKSMVESLARCVRWASSGGKSGSAFLKTRDDRFIAKEVSKAELQTMETFGPAYFDYMSSAVSANRPTLLAKVFGCYKLIFRKASASKDKSAGKPKSTQMNLLVMENLFYGRRFSKIYDLKGSTRNRHVQSTGRENEVLLDENLVQTAHLAPFYLREHSKRILRGALYNDSKFLSDINVMDYSLVVGVDSNNNELVVGIVDYIRTYTWDKKLESWVKESAFLGSGGKGEPTIVTPRQYRQRFISAMERYFPLVPDRWMKQKDAPEEEGDSLLELWPDW